MCEKYYWAACPPINNVITFFPLGGKPSVPSGGGLKDEIAIAQEQQQLQAKILSILGGSSAGTGPTTVTSPSMSATAQAQAAYYASQKTGSNTTTTSSTSINFNNPSVQQALDNLMSTGGLKSIGGGDQPGGTATGTVATAQYAAAQQVSPVANTASSYAQSPATPGVYQAYQQQQAEQYAAAGQQAPAGSSGGYAGIGVQQPTTGGAGYTGYQYQGY